jgi:alpha-glucosidase
MVFSERRRDSSVAHQIASLAAFASPLLTIAANPETILASPAVDVIKTIPSTWDETIVLPGSEIGELAAYARRKGDTWYVAVMCGPAAKTITVPLSFLGDGQYRASVVRDEAPDGSTVKVESVMHLRRDVLTIELRGGGGFVARFAPVTAR